MEIVDTICGKVVYQGLLPQRPCMLWHRWRCIATTHILSYVVCLSCDLRRITQIGDSEQILDTRWADRRMSHGELIKQYAYFLEGNTPPGWNPESWQAYLKEQGVCIP